MKRRAFLGIVAAAPLAKFAPSVLKALPEAVPEIITFAGDPVEYQIVGAAVGGNTLTSLLPDLYHALDIVSREMTGFARSLEISNRRPGLLFPTKE